MNWLVIVGVVVLLAVSSTASHVSSDADLRPVFDWLVAHGGWINHKRLHFRPVSEPLSGSGKLFEAFLREPSTLGRAASELLDAADTSLQPERSFPATGPSSFSPSRSSAWGPDPVLLYVPNECCLHANSARLQDKTRERLARFDALLSKSDGDIVGLASLLRLAVALASELSAVQQSFWAPYLATFDWRSSFVGAVATDRDREFLLAVGANELVDNIVNTQRILQQCYAAVFTEADDISYGEFSLACAATLARSSTGALVPLVDLFSHDGNAVRNNRIFETGGGLVMKASVPWRDDPIAPGQPLHISHGQNSNENLFLQFGVVLHHNRNDLLCFERSDCRSLEAMRTAPPAKPAVATIVNFLAGFVDKLAEAKRNHPPDHALVVRWADEQVAFLQEAIATCQFAHSQQQ